MAKHDVYNAMMTDGDVIIVLVSEGDRSYRMTCFEKGPNCAIVHLSHCGEGHGESQCCHGEDQRPW